MIEKLESIEAKYEQMTADMADPAVQADNAKFRTLSKGVSEMQELVDRFRDYKNIAAQIAATEEMLKDPDMRELAQEEMNELTRRRDALLAEIKVLLVPKIPTTPRTSSSRSAPEPAATKPRCSPRTSSACTAAMPSATAGRWKCCRSATAASAGPRK